MKTFEVTYTKAVTSINKVTQLPETKFFTKLESKHFKVIETAFGPVQSSQSETYYMFLGKEPKLGFKAELDVSLFDIVDKPFHTIKEGTGEPVTIMLKYLYPAR